jgi:hypothetical protein
MTERRRIVNDAGGLQRDVIPEHAPRSGAMSPESRRNAMSHDSGFSSGFALASRNDDRPYATKARRRGA